MDFVKGFVDLLCVCFHIEKGAYILNIGFTRQLLVDIGHLLIDASLKFHEFLLLQFLFN